MKDSSRKFCGFILMLLLLASAVGNGYVLFDTHEHNHVLLQVLAGIGLLATVSALYYSFRGYSKYAAPAYKAYMIITAVYFQFTCGVNALLMPSYAPAPVTVAGVAATCLLFGLCLLLGVAKDMGKKLSYTVCAILQIVAFAELVVLIVAACTQEIDAGAVHMLIARGLTRVVLVAIAALMVSFKYRDKAERGTK